MSDFQHHDGQLQVEGVSLSDLAEQYGTPAYVYSRAAIERHWQSYAEALHTREHLICYAVKANSTLAILGVLARLGSGFDIVSVGELERVLNAGGEAGKIVFSGVGKRRDEMARALDVGIKCFNVESESELQALNLVAADKKMQAPVSLRVNPDVDAATHPYISTGLKENKFGIAYENALDLYQRAAAMSNIDVVGIDFHIGSQITTLAPYIDALEKLMSLVKELEVKGIQLRHIDVGGGLGIQYQDETPPDPAELVKVVCDVIKGEQYELLFEPGRSIVGNAAVLLTRVEYLKQNSGRNFAIVDAAMNDILRPALYDAWLSIVPVVESATAATERYDVVGPVCESADFIGLDRELSIQENDLLAVFSAGAYSFSMSSNYNSRPRAVELLVDKGQVLEIRQRESIESLMQGELRL